MFYFTVQQSPKHVQMSLEDLFSGKTFEEPEFDPTGTITHEVSDINDRMTSHAHRIMPTIYNSLTRFVNKYEFLYEADRDSLYDTYKIPKHHGGLRTINAPKPELHKALDELVSILKVDFGCDYTYHTSAYAYIKRRSTVACAERHKKNGSKWFARYDIHDFFGSTTLDFVMEMLGMVYPFNFVMQYPQVKEVLRKAIELGFKDGGLPQGTPLSPLLTNVIMLPFDFKVANALRNFKVEKDGREFMQTFVYTRYSDDMYVSSRYDFNPKQIENFLCDTLRDLHATFELNKEKTKYNSNQGACPNWILGVQINAQNEITVGSKRKKIAEATMLSYALDRKNGIVWDLEDIRHMMGELSYIEMVERPKYKKMLEKVNKKAGFDVWATANNEIKERVA